MFLKAYAWSSPVFTLPVPKNASLGDQNMADNIMAAENNGGYNYGGIPEKPPQFTLPSE